jgi:hypothetical protein
MNHKPEQTYRRLKGVDFIEVPDGYVIYNDSGEQAIYLNQTAAAVFELCDVETEATSIAATLQQAFGLSHPPVADVEVCLRSLVSEGLVELCDDPPKPGLISSLKRLVKRT